MKKRRFVQETEEEKFKKLSIMLFQCYNAYIVQSCVWQIICVTKVIKMATLKGFPSNNFMFSIKKMTHIATKTTWRQRLISIFCTVKSHEIISIFFEREKKGNSHAFFMIFKTKSKRFYRLIIKGFFLKAVLSRIIIDLFCEINAYFY